MSPQQYVPKLPDGYTEEKTPKGFQFLESIPKGFLVAFRERPWGHTQCKRYTPDKKIAVRLPDERLIIPTVQGEKET